MTQEQLAMLLGVSRQSVTKWESGKSYPEMDKLLKMCQLFGCQLDDLVQGDLTSTEPDAASVVAPDAFPTDICGYDEHMRRHALRFSTGIALLIMGPAVCSILMGIVDAASSTVDALSLVALCVFVAAGLAFLIPDHIEHSSFEKNHPYVADFYTKAEKEQAAHQRGIALVAGIAVILAGACVSTFGDSTVFEDALGGVFLVFAAVGVWIILYWGMLARRTDVARYNKDALEDIDEDDIDGAELDPSRRAELHRSIKSRRKRVTSAVCATIMLVATIVALIWLFSPMFTGASWNFNENPSYAMFWIPWVIGGICCGIAAILIDAFVKE